ncbi:RNA polymerase sigma factor [Fuerstiella marisgermanici]|uniref:RNA polymerase sigma factor SigS n=1 Tax=Fuerstiella marisgermanici TaxID=1891926 RepID=A0A1P8WNQ2_9PLAN|nr:sigma-70 family RNA polymerase sigma factor [Fuerstiella marisgermanici]APZ95681.1 RNA polymerase sigma factor [Fuerstiella marisgermanici]
MTEELTNESFAAFRDTLRDGSEDAFRRVVEQFGPYVMRTIRRRLDDRMRSRLDSNDFAQAVWMTVFEHRDRLEDLDSQERLIAFLVTIAQRKVRGEFRRNVQAEKQNVNRETRAGRESFVLALPDRNQERASQILIAAEQWERMTADEPERYRRILELRRDGATVDEIALATDVNERTVRRVIQRIAEKLE